MQKQYGEASQELAAKAKAAESARKRRDADAARIEAEREAWRAEMDAAEKEEAEAARAALRAPATPERSLERSPGGRASASPFLLQSRFLCRRKRPGTAFAAGAAWRRRACKEWETRAFWSRVREWDGFFWGI